MVWDPSGERLAVLMKGKEQRDGACFEMVSLSSLGCPGTHWGFLSPLSPRLH